MSVVILLVLAATGAAPSPQSPQSRRVTLFEPCAGPLHQGSAQDALAQIAADGSYAYERIGMEAGARGWLRLLANPPAALYIHTVGDSQLMGIACFATERARQFALEELASDPATRSLTVVPRVYTADDRRVWVIAAPRQPGAMALRAAGTYLYLHLANGPRLGGGATPEVVGDASLGPSLVHHRAAATRYFREHLVGEERGTNAELIRVHDGAGQPDALAPNDVSADLRVVGDRPPMITAPSSVEFSCGGGVAVSARDPDGGPVHLEALLPPGVDLHPTGAGRAELRFAQYDFPGTPVAEVVLVAWSGEHRDKAHVRVHSIQIVGGDVGPTPWILICFWGAALAMVLAAFVSRLYARRRRTVAA